MAKEKAKTFADRLPPIVPEEEQDISHLSDEMAAILYPGRRERPFRMGIEFERFDGPDYARAVEVARRSAEYRESGAERGQRHHASFETSDAALLLELFNLVGERPETEVLVDGRQVPYARELWLPLFWIFAGPVASACAKLISLIALEISSSVIWVPSVEGT